MSNTLKKKSINKKSYIILFCILIISLSIVVYNIVISIKDNKTNSNIRNQLNSIYEEIDRNEDKNNNESKKEITKIDKLKQLQQENSEIVALIEIEGTNINYPVLQTNNNDYYMTHNYKKEYSKDGALFLDKAYDWSRPSTNLLIYGHNNIGSSEMFVELLKYKKETFYKQHKTINFTTSEEEAKFEIIAVFKSRVYYQHENNVFRYYYFIDAKNETEFNNYVTNAKKASLYNIEATAKYEDQLLTLSTCEYSQKDGRFVVVARKITREQ